MMAGMEDLGNLLSLVSPGIDDQAILTELGRVAARSTVLEYTIAVLAALTDGCRGDAVDDRALQIVRQTGGARRQLAHLARIRPRIKWLCNDTARSMTPWSSSPPRLSRSTPGISRRTAPGSGAPSTPS
jgi:hypothetical protein